MAKSNDPPDFAERRATPPDVFHGLRHFHEQNVAQEFLSNYRGVDPTVIYVVLVLWVKPSAYELVIDDKDFTDRQRGIDAIHQPFCLRLTAFLLADEKTNLRF